MAFHHKILGIVTLLYLCLFFIHLIFFAFKKEKIVAIMWPLLYGTLGLHTVGLILRWLESYRHGMGHAPLSNFYESLVFYAWCVSLIVVFMKKRLNDPAITVCATVISLFLWVMHRFLHPLTEISNLSYLPSKATGSTSMYLRVSLPTPRLPSHLLVGFFICLPGKMLFLHGIFLMKSIIEVLL